MDKRCGTYTMEYYSAYKKRKLKKGNIATCDMDELSGCYDKWVDRKGQNGILLKQIKQKQNLSNRLVVTYQKWSGVGNGEKSKRGERYNDGWELDFWW